MSEQRWGFEDLDESEFEALSHQKTVPDESDADEPGLVGQDADAVVAVTVSAEGAIQMVRLAQDWRDAVDPRVLADNVVAAVNAATMQALAEQMAEFERNPSAGQAPPVTSTTVQDESPLTAQDMQRLSEAVAAELQSFTRQAFPQRDQEVAAVSAGGHVEGTARNGQLLGLNIDADWSASARNSEIESELLQVLRDLHRRSTRDASVRMSENSAMAEALGLLYDPQRLIRRVELGNPTRHDPERRNDG